MAVTSSKLEESPAESAPEASPDKPRPTQPIPTGRISFTKQIDILRTYAAASGVGKKVVKIDEVENILKLKSSTISLANPFFTAIGLIQKVDRGFVPSDAVISFHRAFAWNPETAAQKLAPVIQTTWFAQKLMPKLAFRNMTEAEAINDLADASNADPEYAPQLRLLLDYLAVAGLILRDGDQIRNNMNMHTGGPMGASTASQVEEADPAPAKPAVAAVAVSSQPEGVIQFHVSVKVDMAEFAGWDPNRITAFFGGIAQVLAAKGKLEGK